jgi:hypothetical protein
MTNNIVYATSFPSMAILDWSGFLWLGVFGYFVAEFGFPVPVPEDCVGTVCIRSRYERGGKEMPRQLTGLNPRETKCTRC